MSSPRGRKANPLAPSAPHPELPYKVGDPAFTLLMNRVIIPGIVEYISPPTRLRGDAVRIVEMLPSKKDGRLVAVVSKYWESDIHLRTPTSLYKRKDGSVYPMSRLQEFVDKGHTLQKSLRAVAESTDDDDVEMTLRS